MTTPTVGVPIPAIAGSGSVAPDGTLTVAPGGALAVTVGAVTVNGIRLDPKDTAVVVSLVVVQYADVTNTETVWSGPAGFVGVGTTPPDLDARIPIAPMADGTWSGALLYANQGSSVPADYPFPVLPSPAVPLTAVSGPHFAVRAVVQLFGRSPVTMMGGAGNRIRFLDGPSGATVRIAHPTGAPWIDLDGNGTVTVQASTLIDLQSQKVVADSDLAIGGDVAVVGDAGVAGAVVVSGSVTAATVVIQP